MVGLVPQLCECGHSSCWCTFYNFTGNNFFAGKGKSREMFCLGARIKDGSAIRNHSVPVSDQHFFINFLKVTKSSY